MTTVQTHDDEARIQHGIAELQGMIQKRFSEAAFAVFRGTDPDGVYLRVTVDVADTDEVVDAIIDRLIELQVAEGLPLFVVPVSPAKRSLEHEAAGVSTQRKHDATPM